jgi:hypothetical protein
MLAAQNLPFGCMFDGLILFPFFLDFMGGNLWERGFR